MLLSWCCVCSEQATNAIRGQAIRHPRGGSTGEERKHSSAGAAPATAGEGHEAAPTEGTGPWHVKVRTCDPLYSVPCYSVGRVITRGAFIKTVSVLEIRKEIGSFGRYPSVNLLQCYSLTGGFVVQCLFKSHFIVSVCVKLLHLLTHFWWVLGYPTKGSCFCGRASKISHLRNKFSSMFTFKKFFFKHMAREEDFSRYLFCFSDIHMCLLFSLKNKRRYLKKGSISWSLFCWSWQDWWWIWAIWFW